jgi:spermidine synthase
LEEIQRPESRIAHAGHEQEVFANALTLALSEGSGHNITAFAWKGTDLSPSRPCSTARALSCAHIVNLHATAMRIEYGKQLSRTRETPAP